MLNRMTTKTVSVLGLIAVSAVATWMFFKQPDQRESAAPNAVHFHTPSPPIETPPLTAAPEPPDIQPSLAEAPPPLPDGPPAFAVLPSPRPTRTSAGAPSLPRNASKPAVAPGRKPKPPLQDPTARVAMSFVGADPEAEAYWLEAIFDPSLPDREREDLMEDLNEEGLSDHKRPGPEDLPLIINRLALIEQIAPEADEFMLTHLQEAYKDLVNLAHITQGEGSPVK